MWASVYAFGSHLALVGPTLDMARSPVFTPSTASTSSLHVPSIGTSALQRLYSSTALYSPLQLYSSTSSTVYIPLHHPSACCSRCKLRPLGLRLEFKRRQGGLHWQSRALRCASQVSNTLYGIARNLCQLPKKAVGAFADPLLPMFLHQNPKSLQTLERWQAGSASYLLTI